MIVNEQPDGSLRIVRQPDHAVTCAHMARAWRRPQAFDADLWTAFCWTVEHHDDGWIDELIDPPIDFKEMPTVRHTEIWRRSIDLARAHSPFAGVLIALYARHLYTSFRNEQLDDAQLSQQFIDELTSALAGEMPDTGVEPTTLQAALRLLGFFDALSLALLDGIPWFDRYEGLAFGDVAATLRVDRDGERVRINPWPFTAEHIELTTRSRPIDLLWTMDSATIADSEG